MFAWLKKLFRRQDQFIQVAKVGPDFDDDADYEKVRADAIRRAFETGNTIIGNRREDGSWDTTEIKPK